MQNERMGHWFSEDGLILKLESQVSRAIMNGAKISISINTCTIGEEKCIISVLRVADYVGDPLHLYGIVNTEEEVESLRKFTFNQEFNIFIFDEMNLPSLDIISIIDGCNPINGETRDGVFLGKLGEIQETFLDEFRGQLQALNYCELNLLQMVPQSVSVINNPRPSHHELTLERGNQQEQGAYSLMTSIFIDQIHHSLIDEESHNKREIIDIISWYENGIFIIESKALGSDDLNQSIGRKIKNLKGNINKALSQIKGAAKSVRELKKQVIINLNLPEEKDYIYIHGIVLISDFDLLGREDFNELFPELERLFLENKILINIFDLSELSNIVHITGYLSKGDIRVRQGILDSILQDRAIEAILRRNLYRKVNLRNDPG